LTISTDGDHGLEGRATDNAGNQTTTVTVVHIDTIPPVATFIMPSPDSTTQVQEAISLGGNVFDVGSGVERVELSLDEGKTWQTLHLVNEIWRYDWVTLGIPNGQYRVVARAWDLAGNVQTPGTSTTLIVDNRPPFIAIQERWLSGSLAGCMSKRKMACPWRMSASLFAIRRGAGQISFGIMPPIRFLKRLVGTVVLRMEYWHLWESTKSLRKPGIFMAIGPQIEA
jgi:hypothetical protein